MFLAPGAVAVVISRGEGGGEGVGEEMVICEKSWLRKSVCLFPSMCHIPTGILVLLDILYILHWDI